MRTVLLGTDFMYDKDGNLRPIEINTNVTLNPNSIIENVEDVFDFSELQSFITSNNFTKLVYIGDISQLNDSLTSFCGTNSITYTYYNVGGDSLTVPYVEDGDDILIIRSAYDTTAIIDDTYCADKTNFVKLIGSSSFGLQYAMTDENGNLQNTITTINDNGVHPNFILKDRNPNYDIDVYPKLLKISNQTELNQVIGSLTNQYILTEFLYNENKLYSNSHIQVIRSYNLLYPPTLQSISIGQNTQIPEVDLFSSTPEYNSGTFELESKYRARYLTNVIKVAGHPKLKDTDRVEMADGTWKAPNELVEGDVIKTIVFPTVSNDQTDEHFNFHVDYTTFVSGLTYTTTTIDYVTKINTYSKITTITFDDSTTWEDGQFVTFLTVRNNEVQWIESSLLVAGDQVIAVQTVDTDNNGVFDTLVKTVSSAVTNSVIFEGWVVSVVGESHCYIVKDSIHNNSFALFEHNTSCAACVTCNGQCSVCPNKAQPYCSIQRICTAPNC
jgi:hypothetical protein